MSRATARVLFTEPGPHLQDALSRWRDGFVSGAPHRDASGVLQFEVSWSQADALYRDLTADATGGEAPLWDFDSAIFPGREGAAPRIVLGNAVERLRQHQAALPKLSATPAQILGLVRSGSGAVSAV